MTLKLGSNVVNTIKLGSNRVSMIKLGTTTIYPASAPPSSTVLESFDTLNATGGPLVYVGDQTWTALTLTATAAITLTTSHITQGTHTWRLRDVAGYGGAGNSTTYADSDLVTGVDLSAYTQIQIDVFNASQPSTGYAALLVYDLGDFSNASDQTASGATGAATLTANLSTLTSKTNCAIIWGASDDGGGGLGAYDVYFDNLRAS